MAMHIGTSGWSYDHWDGVLYSHGTPARERLAVYVSTFETVELNASFYRWPRDRTFAGWRRRLPDGFMMSVKAPRGLTHAKRLDAPETWAGRLAAGWHELADRRGVLLVQLVPTHTRDDRRLDYFLGCLPWWMRVAVEFRHDSWVDDAVFDILERHGAAYCVMSGAGLPCVLRATAPFVYVRLHGPAHDHLYAGSYSDDDLRWWADRLAEWERSGLDVFAYFQQRRRRPRSPQRHHAHLDGRRTPTPSASLTEASGSSSPASNNVGSSTTGAAVTGSGNGASAGTKVRRRRKRVERAPLQ